MKEGAQRYQLDTDILSRKVMLKPRGLFFPSSLQKQIIWRQSHRGREERSAQKLVCLLPALQVISAPFQGLASPPVAGCQVQEAAVERSLSHVLSTLGSADMLKL